MGDDLAVLIMAGAALVNTLGDGDHVCSAVAGTARRHALTVEYVDGGLRDGYKVLVIDSELGALRRTLLRRRPDADAAIDRGQVTLVTSEEAYLPDGRFEPRRMADAVAADVDLAVREGYQGLRAVGDLSWVGPAGLDGDALVGYESLMNQHYVDKRFIGMCHYDPTALDPALWRRLTEVHPCLSRSDGHEVVSRLRCRRTGGTVRLSGEIDLVNRGALPGLISAATAGPGECRIDLTDLRFADASAAATLLRVADDRRPAHTTIICSSYLAGLLHMLGAATVPGLSVITPTR